MNNAHLFEHEQCPYDKSHVILKSRFQVHLGRCRKNHLTAAKATCPFNVTHIVEKPELDWHVRNCPNRTAFERYKQDIPSASGCKSADELPPQYEMQRDNNAENWDNADCPTYNPQEYVSKAKVLRHAQGIPPAERKKFRNEERLRHVDLKESLNSNLPRKL